LKNIPAGTDLHTSLKNCWKYRSYRRKLVSCIKKLKDGHYSLCLQNHTGIVSDHEADEMLSLAKNVRKKVEDWLSKNYPELLVAS